MLSGIRERKEWKKVSEGTKELPYEEVFRKGFVFLLFSFLIIENNQEIWNLYFPFSNCPHRTHTEADNIPLISLTGLIFYISSYCQNMCWRSHPHFFSRKHVHCTCSLAKELHSPSNKSWLSVVPIAQRITGCDEILLYRPFSVSSLLAVTEELKSLELAKVVREMIKKHATKTGIKLS